MKCDKNIKPLENAAQCAIQNVSCFVPKRHNHDHFWIEDGILFESYNTIRGMRYNEIKQVPGMPDMDKCDEAVITYIAKEYYS